MKWRVQLDKIIIQGVSEDPVRSIFKAGQQKQIHVQIGSFEDVRPGTLEIVLELSLDIPNTQLDLFVTSITHPGQQHNIKTIQTHTAPETISCVTVRSIAYQDSVHAYHAMINLEPGSINASAQQENKIVVLGDAQVISEPTLYITHNQVSCAHGTAVGQLDADQLLYLQLRGIENIEAESILLAGFVKL